MPRRGRRKGKCRLCGSNGHLSFEHVPPEKAFNNRRSVILKLEDTIALGPDAPTRGKIQQGGAGDHTLCVRCNTNTGHWYAPALIAWCYRGMEILERSGGAPRLFSIYYTYPLRVLKEILVMFCSVNGEDFTDAQPWLRRYLLNPTERALDPAFRVFVYYNVSSKARYAGLSGQFDIDTGRSTMLSEITYPPFGYLLTVDSEPPDPRLVEITFFASYRYNELASLDIHLPLLPIVLAYPGDYRTRAEILENRAKSTAAMGDLRRPNRP